MNSSARWITFLLITLCSPCFSQKVKYKDLFVLLNAKQFENAEPFLKKYLRVNTDNPNAYLFMGMIYQDRSVKLDYLKQTRELVTLIDSAVYFYDKAIKGITERELSRNDEYYQMYNRRDLRTGKFGVKLSDVQLDLENRLKLKERGTQILTLKAQFLAAENCYKRTEMLFDKIQKTYSGQKEFFLRADDQLISDLRRMAQLYDSCHMNFNDYKATSQALGKTGYNQDLDPEEIKDFKKDGTAPVDFYKDDLRLWDYRRWALSSTATIENEINPLKDQLVALDVDINKIQQKLKKDSVSVREEIPGLLSRFSFPALRKVDPQPMPLKIFEMKVSELEYGSQIVEDRSLRDSLNVDLHLNAVRRELALIKKVDSLSGLLTERNLDEEAENYKHFVTNAYGTPAVLKSQIKSTKDFAMREVARKESELKRKNESLRWLVIAPDSIPLFMEVLPASRFKPMIVEGGKFTAGLQYADSLAKGYFYFISSSRKSDTKGAFPVDHEVFKKRNLPFAKSLSTQDEKAQVYFIMFYSEAKIKDKFPATIAKIHRADGLTWSLNYSFDQSPEQLIFSPDTAELSVRTKNAAGEVLGVVFDKNGKVVK